MIYPAHPGWVHETIAEVCWEGDSCILRDSEGWLLYIPARDLRGIVPRAGDRYSMYVRDAMRSSVGQTIQKLVIGEALIWDE